jgi:hypothetical protein
MVDAVNLMLLRAAQDGGVQRLGRGLVVAKRLLDHHVAPVFGLDAVLVPVLLQKAGFPQVGDDGAEEAIGDGQVEQAVAAGVGFLLKLLFQFFVKAVIAEVAFDIGDVSGQAFPGVLINTVDAAFAGGFADKGLHHLMQAVAPFVGVEVGEIHPDQGKMLRQQAGGGKVVQGRDQKTLRQVSAGAEDDHGAGARWRSGAPGRGRDDLALWVGRGRLHVCHVWQDEVPECGLATR